MKINSRLKIYFLLPNSLNHGAQNFFRRLHENFPIEAHKKEIVFQNTRSFWQIAYDLLISSFRGRVIVFSTVNSNKTALLLKLLIPTIIIYPRLGNTISEEIKKFSIKYYAHMFFYKLLVYYSKAFIFQSVSMHEDFQSFFNIHSDKFHVINNGVTLKTRLNKSKDQSANSKINFLLVGTFKAQKGYDIFFRSILDTQFPGEVHFNICGDGELLDHFKQIANHYSLNKLVTFHGFIDPTDLYLSNDFYILPSKFEGFSNSLIEALSYGIPSIVSDAPGANREVISDGFNGFLFRNKDPVDLRSKINSCIKSEKFNRKDIILDIKNRFSIEKIASQYYNLAMKKIS